MSLFIWTVVAGFFGWAASIAMQGNASNHRIMHASIGISGAVLGGLLMSTPIRINPSAPDEFSLLSLMVSFFMALALSMIANLWHRVSVQDDAEMDF